MTCLALRTIKEIPTCSQVPLLQPPKERALPPLPPPQLAKSIIEIPHPYFPPTEGPIENGDIIAGPPNVLSDRPATPPVIPPPDVTRVQEGPGRRFPKTIAT